MTLFMYKLQLLQNNSDTHHHMYNFLRKNIITERTIFKIPTALLSIIVSLNDKNKYNI